MEDHSFLNDSLCDRFTFNWITISIFLFSVVLKIKFQKIFWPDKEMHEMSSLEATVVLTALEKVLTGNKMWRGSFSWCSLHNTFQ